jgi:VanZ family protein
VKKYSARGAQPRGGNTLFKRFLYYWAPIVIYCLLIFFQSSYPSLETTPNLPFMDKILHGGGYALLGFLFYRALRTLRIGNRTVLLIFISAVLSTLYGLSDEIHQHFVVFRDADFMDVVADMFGSIIGAWGAFLYYKKHALTNDV